MNIYYCSKSFFTKKRAQIFVSSALLHFKISLSKLAKIYFVYPKMMLHNRNHVARQPGINL